MLRSRRTIIIIVLIFIVGGVYYSTIRKERDPEDQPVGKFQNPTSAPWVNGPSGPPPSATPQIPSTKHQIPN